MSFYLLLHWLEFPVQCLIDMLRTMNAAAAAKSLQSCPSLCDPISISVRPHRRQPTRLPCPWDSSGKNTGVGCHFLLQCRKVKVKSLSHVQLLATPWTAAYQAPPSMGFARQEYWSGVPSPSPRCWISKFFHFFPPFFKMIMWFFMF